MRYWKDFNLVYLWWWTYFKNFEIGVYQFLNSNFSYGHSNINWIFISGFVCPMNGICRCLWTYKVCGWYNILCVYFVCVCLASALSCLCTFIAWDLHFFLFIFFFLGGVILLESIQKSRGISIFCPSLTQFCLNLHKLLILETFWSFMIPLTFIQNKCWDKFHFRSRVPT